MARRTEWVQRSFGNMGEVVVQINGELIDVGTAQPTEHLTGTQARSLAKHLMAAADNLDKPTDQGISQPAKEEA